MIRSKLLAALVLAVGLLCIWGSDTASAQRPSRRGTPAASGPERKGWAGAPWLVGVLLSAGIVAVGFKSAKRYHLE